MSQAQLKWLVQTSMAAITLVGLVQTGRKHGWL
jgi:hypothetical protein